MHEYIKNKNSHMLDELARIYHLLQFAVKPSYKNESAEKFEHLRGLFISHEEINDIVNVKSIDWNQSLIIGNNDSRTLSFLQVMDDENKKIDNKILECADEGFIPPLMMLAEIFQLSAIEIDIILLCCATDVDLSFGKLFGYLHDNIAWRYPTINLMLQLLAKSIDQKMEIREMFSHNSPLIKYRLIEKINPEETIPHGSRQYKVNERILSYLMGHNILDSKLSSISSIIEPYEPFSIKKIPDQLYKHFNEFSQRYISSDDAFDNKIVFLFYGQYGAGQEEAAKGLCSEINLPLLTIDLKGIDYTNSSFVDLIDCIILEGLLLTSVIYLKVEDKLSGDEAADNYNKKILFQKLQQHFTLSFIESDAPIDITGEFTSKGIIEVDFPVIDYHKRKELWEEEISNFNYISSECDIEDFSGKFNFTAGQIEDVMKTAYNRALWESPKNPEIVKEDILKGCRLQSNQGLSRIAKKIKPIYKLEDIILPIDMKSQLYDIVNFYNHKHRVYIDWGFEKKLSLGKGLTILLSGVPGTGKTMAAEIIANELQLDLYKIDLSSVVSKYIGETEKNLEQIFNEAELSNSVLFFDEADALFGKRSEINDSHDRHANIETGYLLQKMDEFTGIVILATNLKNNMDDAFIRRLQFTLEFPFPDADSRLTIWNNIFPSDTPLYDDVDFEFLSQQFNVSGGSIKNIALASAFYAVIGNESVGMKHIIPAIKREYQKSGKLCVKDDFGEYYNLLKMDTGL